MMKQTIQIYCRIKPTKKVSGIFDISEDDDSSLISFHIPRDLSDGIINNKKENYQFKFDHVFEQRDEQDVVFTQAACPIIESVLAGYNGTIFAYGQTGSGKTFTITGGAERYVDRGIIPRALSRIFEQQEKNPDFIYTTHISYLEIYNENGYDLLDPKHEASKLEDLPKVALLEDNDGNIHLKNLSVHQASNVEEALNLLFLGDTNRMIAETPMNEASTRSHCIFTVHVTVRQLNSAKINKSKLHLVDLAGSERVSKTGENGVLLKEAKYINLSLHYLEQVIIALSEKSRNHIPFRNSMMTSVLRDSLGGNCMTSMIATCSVDKRDIDESISTCRFAQRVALIKNEAFLNEELDPKLQIAKLKLEIQELKDELSLTKGLAYESDLTEAEYQRMQELVWSYVEDKEQEAMLAVGADMRKINFCFRQLKQLYHNKAIMATPDNIQLSPNNPDNGVAAENSYLGSIKEVEKLKELVFQRDNEINILVGMLKKEKERFNKLEQSPQETLTQVPEEESLPSVYQKEREKLVNRAVEKKNDGIGRHEAFKIFKSNYSDKRNIDETTRGLKTRYADAKKLGNQVNESRQILNGIKAKLGGMKGLPQVNEEEKQLREDLEKEKITYKRCFGGLKALKCEIEHMQHLLENSKVRLQKDFEVWWEKQTEDFKGEKSQQPIPQRLASKRSLRSETSKLQHKPASNKLHPIEKRTSSSRIQLTGDEQIDEDILEFMKAREMLSKKSHQ